MDFSFLSKLFDHRLTAVTLLGSSLTSLYLLDTEVIKSLRDDASILIVIAVIAAWLIISKLLDGGYAFTVSGARKWMAARHAADVTRRQSDAAQLQRETAERQKLDRLAVLTPRQSETLRYIRQKGQFLFQANVHDEDIQALTNMKLIDRRESVPQHFAVYEISPAVFDAVEPGEPVDEAPWIVRRR